MTIHPTCSRLRVALLTVVAFVLGSTATPTSAQIVRVPVASATSSTSISATPALGTNAAIPSAILTPVSYTHLTLPTNREV